MRVHFPKIRRAGHDKALPCKPGRRAQTERFRTVLCGFGAEEGQTVVEFALVFVMFIYLVFAVFDFGHLFFVEMDVQNALQEAARYGSTGNHLPDPKNPGQSLSRVTSIVDTLQNDVTGVNLTNIQVSSVNGGSSSAGGPGDLMTITASVSIPLITPMLARLFPNGAYATTSSITVLNEPFPSSETN